VLSVFQITQHPGFPFSKTAQDRVWGPSSLLFNKNRGSFTGVKQPGCQFTTHFQLLPRVRMYL